MRSTVLPNKPLPGMGIAWGHPLARDLVARFLFNEGAGIRLNNLAAQGSGRDAILTNMDPATDWIGSDRGGALAFDGVDDYAQAFGSVNIHGAMQATVCAWFRTTAAQTDKVLVSLPTTAPDPSVSGMGVRLATTTAVGSDLYASGVDSLTFTTSYNDGRWHFIAQTYNGFNTGADITHRLYYDGKLVASSAVPEGALSARTLHCNIGAFAAGVSNCACDMSDVRVYKRELSGDEIARLYTDPYADTHRPVWVFPDRAHSALEVEAFINGDWLNLTDLSGEVSIDYGISGAGPLAIIAGTGTMSWALNNSEQNSQGKLGLYSPENANLLAGFKVGIPVRFTYRGPVTGTAYRKHVGWMQSIDPDPFILGERKTKCTSADWMNQAAEAETIGVGVLVGKRSDEAITALAGVVSRPPTSMDVDAGVVTFQFADFKAGESVMTALTRVGLSEFASGLFVRGDGALCFRNRTSRLHPVVVATIHDELASTRAPQSTGQVKNRVLVKTHPRRVDAAPVVLWQLPSDSTPPVVQPGKPLRVAFRFADPVNRETKIAGINMIAPTATTDYTMNKNPLGGGLDLTASFAVTAAYGSSGGELLITDNSSFRGFITKLQVRGQGLYDLAPVEAVLINQASIDEHGKSEITVDMAFESDPSAGVSVGEYILSQVANPATTELPIRIIATTPALIEMVLALEPRVALDVSENVTGVNHTFFVQHLSYRFPEKGIVECALTLQRAPIGPFWLAGVVGSGEAGVTTFAAPL